MTFMDETERIIWATTFCQVLLKHGPETRPKYAEEQADLAVEAYRQLNLRDKDAYR